MPDEAEDITKKLYIAEKDLSRLEERKKLLQQQNYIVQDIFEKGEIHFIAGPSGVGKSSWVYKMIHDWSVSKAIFGKYKSYPDKYVYIVCDRSFLLTALTLRRLSLEDWDIPIFTVDELMAEVYNSRALRNRLGWTDEDLERGRKLSLIEVSALLPWAKVLFIDAIGWFDPVIASKQMGYTQAMNYWGAVRRHLTETGKTIIATAHSPKAKGKERYGNPRDRVSGTNGTMGSIATIINIDFVDEENVSDSHRVISVSARNIQGEVYYYKFDEKGDFVYTEAVNLKGVPKKVPKDNEKQTYLDSVRYHLNRIGAKPGEVFKGVKLLQLKDWAEIKSDATWYRVLDDLCEQGTFEWIGKGCYRVPNKHGSLKGENG